MLQTLIHHPYASFFFGFMAIVALTFGAHWVGMNAWLSWLDRSQSNHRKSGRGGKHRDEAAKEYWRVHQ